MCFLFNSAWLIAQGGQLLLMRVELFGIALHQLLLAADVVQAVDVLADAVFVAGEIANLVAGVFEGMVVLGDLRFLVGDALQLPPSGIAEACGSECTSRGSRASRWSPGSTHRIDALLVDHEFLRRAGAEGDFEAIRTRGLLRRASD